MKSKSMFHRKARGLAITRLMARDGNACGICSRELDRRLRDPDHDLFITFDHIVPRSAGGFDDLPNLRLAHRRCNLLRGNDPLEEE